MSRLSHCPGGAGPEVRRWSVDPGVASSARGSSPSRPLSPARSAGWQRGRDLPGDGVLVRRGVGGRPPRLLRHPRAGRVRDADLAGQQLRHHLLAARGVRAGARGVGRGSPRPPSGPARLLRPLRRPPHRLLVPRPQRLRRRRRGRDPGRARQVGAGLVRRLAGQAGVERQRAADGRVPPEQEHARPATLRPAPRSQPTLLRLRPVAPPRRHRRHQRRDHLGRRRQRSVGHGHARVAVRGRAEQARGAIRHGPRQRLPVDHDQAAGTYLRSGRAGAHRRPLAVPHPRRPAGGAARTVGAPGAGSLPGVRERRRRQQPDPLGVRGRPAGMPAGALRLADAFRGSVAPATYPDAVQGVAFGVQMEAWW